VRVIYKSPVKLAQIEGDLGLFPRPSRGRKLTAKVKLPGIGEVAAEQQWATREQSDVDRIRRAVAKLEDLGQIGLLGQPGPAWVKGCYEMTWGAIGAMGREEAAWFFYDGPGASTGRTLVMLSGDLTNLRDFRGPSADRHPYFSPSSITGLRPVIERLGLEISPLAEPMDARQPLDAQTVLGEAYTISVYCRHGMAAEVAEVEFVARVFGGFHFTGLALDRGPRFECAVLGSPLFVADRGLVLSDFKPPPDALLMPGP
jgi:hypothetical protein